MDNTTLADELERLSRQSEADTLMLYGEPEVGLYSQPFFGEPLKGDMRHLADWRGSDAELVIKLWNNLPTILAALRTPPVPEQVAPAPVVVGGEVKHLLDQAYSIFTHCTVTDGSCCCGDSMENHENPMDCGHSPTDHGAYVSYQWVQDYAALQAQPAPAQEVRHET